VSSTTFWYITRASGVVALILLTATMVLGLTTTTRARSRNWPGFARQELHRRISMLSVVFVAIHVLTSVLDTYVHIGWLAIVVPFISPYSPFWVGVGAVALDLMIAVFVSSLLRARRPGAYVRHGDRRRGTLGHRARGRVCSVGRHRPALAGTRRSQAGDGPGVRQGRRHADNTPGCDVLFEEYPQWPIA
jgi:succinate dehydrogenase hydrophobic anchor subunit